MTTETVAAGTEPGPAAAAAPQPPAAPAPPAQPVATVNGPATSSVPAAPSPPASEPQSAPAAPPLPPPAPTGKGQQVPNAEERGPGKLPKAAYEEELLALQAKLVDMQEWVRRSGARVVVIFEGRDAAGKGGTIKRVTEYLNPRSARIAALPAPSDREKTQWYFQRYVDQLPAGGEIVLFDRSWYNRAGVEHVLGFCTEEQYLRFLRQCPTFERMLVEDGIILLKYWFSVSDEEQERRFQSRLNDPMRRWKFSPMDLESRNRWVDFSRAKDANFAHTDTREAPWYVVEANDKRAARLNCIAHLLSKVPWQHVETEVIQLPPRPPAGDYARPPRELYNYVPDYAAALRTNGKADKAAKAGKSGTSQRAEKASKSEGKKSKGKKGK